MQSRHKGDTWQSREEEKKCVDELTVNDVLGTLDAVGKRNRNQA